MDEWAHRIGPFQPANCKPCPIIVWLTSFKYHEAVLRWTEERKPRGIFLNKDFSAQVSRVQKELRPKIQEMKQQGTECYLWLLADVENASLDPDHISINFDTIGHDKHLHNDHADFNLFTDLDQRNSSSCIYVSLVYVHSIVNNTSLGMVHSNVHCLIAHLDALEITILGLKSLTIIGLCETWLSPDNENLYNIPG